jgi:glutaredoxin
MLLLSLIPACASTPQYKTNTEVIVHYNGQEISRTGSKFISFEKFKELAQKKGKKYIIFSARWCKSCQFLDKALKQSGNFDKVTFLDADEEWVQQLMVVAQERNVPTMMVTDERGNFIQTLIGPSKIIMYFITKETN